MNITFLANADTAIYCFRMELVKRLIADGHNVTIVAPCDQYADEFEKAGCKLVKTPVDRRGVNPFKDFKLIRHYVGYMRKTKPDLVLTYTIKPNIYGGFAARLTRTPYAANITGLGTSFEVGGLFTKMVVMMYKVALKRVSVLFCQNQGNLDTVKKLRFVPQEKLCLLNGSGVNLNKFKYKDLPADDGIVKFLFVGRIMSEKGVDELLVAAERLKKECPQVQFTCVGGFEENYGDKIARLQQEGVINYVGEVKDTARYYEQSDCVVLPSWHEGMSNALLEGAATGRALITSNIHGCMEAVNDGVSGFLSTVKDADSLYKRLIQFVELPYEARAQMGREGRKLVEQKFDREKVVDTIIKNILVLK